MWWKKWQWYVNFLRWLIERIESRHVQDADAIALATEKENERLRSQVRLLEQERDQLQEIIDRDRARVIAEAANAVRREQNATNDPNWQG